MSSADEEHEKKLWMVVAGARPAAASFAAPQGEPPGEKLTPEEAAAAALDAEAFRVEVVELAGNIGKLLGEQSPSLAAAALLTVIVAAAEQEPTLRHRFRVQLVDAAMHITNMGVPEDEMAAELANKPQIILPRGVRGH